MKPRCFVVSPIGAPESAIRQRSDAVFRELIAPVAESLGYEAARADMIDEAGVISSQVIRRVVDDQLVVADLTGANPNVYYELAIRHASRRACVCLSEAGEPIPFDIAAYRVVQITASDEQALRSARPALAEMIASATSAESGEMSPTATALREWRFCVPARAVSRELVDAIVFSYLHLSFTLGYRPHASPEQKVHDANLVLGRLRAQLELLAQDLGIPDPDAFRDLEEGQWKAAHGEP